MAVTDLLSTIQTNITKAAQRASRNPKTLCLIAVSKTRAVGEITDVYQQGVRHFGENKVQDAANKFSRLRQTHKDLRLHLLGPLQTNKVKQAISLFDFIHSLDRSKLADALARQADAQGKCPVLFVQVNTGAEPQKAGVLPNDLESLTSHTRALGLPLKGLMVIPPINDAPSGHFGFLAQRAEDLGLPLLSMGMSADYESAVELGATHVRIGTALFGPRNIHAVDA